MTPIPTARLEEIRELAAKATPGPWRGGQLGYVTVASLDRVAECRSAVGARATDNATHIANCDPQTISAIVSELIERRNKDKANG